MSLAEKISPFFGRCALVWFFVAVAGDILTNFHAVDVQLGDKHVPVAPLLLVVAVVLIVLGSLSILFGYHARHGAIILFGLTAAAAVMLHDFWHIPYGATRDAELQTFARDMAICGGLLMIVGLGAGPFAADNRPPPGKKR